MSPAAIRVATDEDLAVIQRALYLAATWQGARPDWPQERLLEHEYFRQFWEDWGRPTDIAVVAEHDGTAVGAAFGRLFTQAHHAHGFVDERTPEIGIGIELQHRGQGVGTVLLKTLATLAQESGLPALSLSVELGNPAMRLYKRSGYVELDRDENAARMILEL